MHIKSQFKNVIKFYFWWNQEGVCMHFFFREICSIYFLTRGYWLLSKVTRNFSRVKSVLKKEHNVTLINKKIHQYFSYVLNFSNNCQKIITCIFCIIMQLNRFCWWYAPVAPVCIKYFFLIFFFFWFFFKVLDFYWCFI